MTDLLQELDRADLRDLSYFYTSYDQGTYSALVAMFRNHQCHTRLFLRTGYAVVCAGLGLAPFRIDFCHRKMTDPRFRLVPRLTTSECLHP